MPGVTAQAQTAHHHIVELRWRVVTCAVIWVCAAALAYLVRGQIIAFIERPLGEKLFYTSPTGSFEFVMRACLLVAALVALPAVVYHLICFVEPALPSRFRKRFLFLVVGCSLTLAVCGIAFAYYVSLPAAFHFFNSFGTGGLHPIITADQYFSFVTGYLAAFAVIFQLPLVLLFIDWIRPFGPGGLGRWRKWVIVGAFGAAILMPSAPDPLSQVILALPILVLFEISVLAVKLQARRRRRAARQRPVHAEARAEAPRPRHQAVPRQAMPVRPDWARGNVLDLSGMTAPEPPPLVNVLDLRPAKN
jgi:sec-independent protein translocase protein TatC